MGIVQRSELKRREIDQFSARIDGEKGFPQMPDIFRQLFSVTSELIPKGLWSLSLGDGDLPVGMAGYQLAETDRDLGLIGVYIKPQFRRQGVGAAVLQVLSDAVLARGGRRLLTKVYQSQREVVHFLERHQFKARGRAHIVCQHLGEPRPAAEDELWRPLSRHMAEAGIVVVPLNHFPRRTLAERLLEIWNRTQPDQPRDWPFEPFSARRLERDILEANDLDFAHSFALLTPENRVIGLSLNGIDTERRLWTHYTGIDPDFRGRQLGLALKLTLLQRSKGAGIVQLAAENDAGNHPMRRINARLGFETVDEWITFEREL